MLEGSLYPALSTSNLILSHAKYTKLQVMWWPCWEMNAPSLVTSCESLQRSWNWLQGKKKSKKNPLKTLILGRVEVKYFHGHLSPGQPFLTLSKHKNSQKGQQIATNCDYIGMLIYCGGSLLFLSFCCFIHILHNPRIPRMD